MNRIRDAEAESAATPIPYASSAFLIFPPAAGLSNNFHYAGRRCFIRCYYLAASISTACYPGRSIDLPEY
jgi:hypothetical protein